MVRTVSSQKVRIVGSQKYKPAYLNKVTNSCKICGNSKLRFNNLKGWTNMSVECANCGQKVTGKTIEKAINEWNKQNEKKLMIKQKDYYIHPKWIMEILGISISTIYRLKKEDLIKKVLRSGYSVDSINDFLNENYKIAEETQASGIKLSENEQMLTTAEVAKILNCPLYQVSKYRTQKHLSYQKISKGKYLYFKEDVERLKKEIKKYKSMRKRIEQAKVRHQNI